MKILRLRRADGFLDSLKAVAGVLGTWEFLTIQPLLVLPLLLYWYTAYPTLVLAAVAPAIVGYRDYRRDVRKRRHSQLLSPKRSEEALEKVVRIFKEKK